MRSGYNFTEYIQRLVEVTQSRQPIPSPLSCIYQDPTYLLLRLQLNFLLLRTTTKLRQLKYFLKFLFPTVLLFFKMDHRSQLAAEVPRCIQEREEAQRSTG